MPLEYHYSTPTTPAGAGSDTTISNAVEILSEHAFMESAELGEAPVVEVKVDDSAAAYDFAGLKRWYINETACPASDRLVWTGYINDQRISRGSGTDQLFPYSSGRRWALSLEEVNAILGFRVITGTDGNRPAETVGERLTWLLAGSDYLTTVGDNGLVAYPTNAMDANDYRGQTAQDVLADCAVETGYIFFAFYDKNADDDQRISLFFQSPNYLGYASTIQISNYADANGTTIFAPSEDTELSRDPSRVAAGVYLPYSGGAVYLYDLPTSYEFGFRDRVAPMAEVKTEAKATILATRFQSDNNTQSDRITTRIRMLAANLNDVKRGQVLQARFQHFPDYTSLSYFRVMRKTWQPPENRTSAFYDVDLELVPVTVSTASCATSLAAIVSEFNTGSSMAAQGSSVSVSVSATPVDTNSILLITCATARGGDTPEPHAMTTPSGFTLVDSFDSDTGAPGGTNWGWRGVIPFVAACKSVPTPTVTPYSANNSYIQGYAAKGSAWVAFLLALKTSATGAQQSRITTWFSAATGTAYLGTGPTPGNVVLLVVSAENVSSITAVESGWTTLETVHIEQPGDATRHRQVNVYVRCYVAGDGTVSDGSQWQFQAGTQHVLAWASEWAVT